MWFVTSQKDGASALGAATRSWLGKLSDCMDMVAQNEEPRYVLIETNSACKFQTIPATESISFQPRIPDYLYQ